ncbi:MAG: alpha/beta hydrolase, partial [Chloroflexi bacterium]|nr:alpha/beta hydrolase [Chloroflexota bacterium]
RYGFGHFRIILRCDDCADRAITLNGLKFHYREWPSARTAAQDLVLLHGFTGHTRSWDSFAQAMSANYRVLALDQRGHGETQWAAPDQYGVDFMVSDLEAFVAALGLDRFVLLGLSMGGRNAIHYAGARPVPLERLVIVDIGPETGATGSARIQASVQANDVFDSVESAIAQGRSANPNADEAEQVHRITHNLVQTADGKWTYRYDRALRGPGNPRPRPSAEEGWQLVRNISVPTLLVRGEVSDVLPREIADRMVEEIADCQFAEVAGSGHSIPLERPQGFLEAVRTFL